MKCVILLALLAVAFAQTAHRPQFDHNNPLHRLMEAEVHQLIQANDGISEADCAAKCDALFDLSAGHDEEITDHLCALECQHQLNIHTHGGDGRTHPTHPSHPTHPPTTA